MENKVISEVKRILKANDVKIVERLMGGMSNYTYVVQADGEKYTYRIPGEYAENFVNRIFEKANIALMEQLGVTNETIYLNTEDGTKLAHYVEGKPLSQFDPSEYPYELVAKSLKKIHHSSLKAINDYEPFERLKTYENLIIALGFKHPNHYKELKEKFFEYKDLLDNTPKVLTHGDSQPSNFVLNNNELLIVDFEFAANNDPIYDVACFANKKYEEGLHLLEVYYPNPSHDEILRFNLWRCFQCMQWYNVATFKELKGMSQTLHIDFAKVADHYLELVEMLLQKVANLDKK